MGLSNTATPYYYGLFKEAVIRGDIPINQEIEMQMNRIEDDIANPNYYYDEAAINGYIKFCEKELTLTDGSDLELLDTFKLWAEDLLSWFYFEERSVYVPDDDYHGGHYENVLVKKRLRNKQYLIIARGGAKSMYASTIQNYFLNVDTSTTQQITIAPTLYQSDEVMGPIRTSITRARGPLFKFLTNGNINSNRSIADKVKLASTKNGIENFLTGSSLKVRPMDINKLQGLKPKVTTIDEWLSGDIREDVVGAIEQGASKIKDYIIVAISSEGTVRNSAGDTIKMELIDILKGEYINPHVSIWYYKLDNIDEVNDPSMWLKANPNIGKIVSYEAYQLDVERMEKAPSTRNDILAKRFGLPMEGFTYFFSYDDILLHRPHEFYNMDCSMGADMSQGDDFCAFTFLFPLKDGSFGVKSRSYITSNTLEKLPVSLRYEYNRFMDEGSLFVFDGIVLNMEHVYDDIDKYIYDNHYNVCTFGYDPYNAKYFTERWIVENGDFGVVKVPQGARTESVPLGELKKLAEERMLIFDQEIIKFTMGNCITIEDTNGNRKLLKKKRDAKIDNVAAMMDAYVAYKENLDIYD